MDRHSGKNDWTYDDLVALKHPRGKKHEILDGELVVSPSASFAHSEVAKRLFLALQKQLERRRLGTVHHAPLDVILSHRRVVQPDLFVIGRDQREIIAPHGIVGAPCLVIEIVSPNHRGHDRVRKRRFYATAGIREYWIVDPELSEIEVLADPDDELYAQVRWFATGDTITSPQFPDLAIAVDHVFGIEPRRPRKPRARARR